jgi:hypothetical protein
MRRRLILAAVVLAVWVLLVVLAGLSSQDAGAAVTWSILGPVLAAALTAAYWLPTWIAWKRGVSNLGSIAVLTLFTAFTFGITWVIAMVWAFADKQAPINRPPKAGEPA